MKRLGFLLRVISFKMLVLLPALYFSNFGYADLKLQDTLQVYEVVSDGKVYSIFTVNRTSRFAVSAYQEYLTDILLIGARDWYLGLHEKQGSFSNPEAIKADFTTGPESLHDGRSTFAIIVEGRAQDIVNELVAQDKILTHPEQFYRGMIRISTASFEHPYPPFYGRLRKLPPNFPQVYDPNIMENDWAELKNLGQDKSLKIDFLPLAIRAIAESGWVDLGGYLRERSTGALVLQGDPSTIDGNARNALEIGDAYEMYHQTDIHKLVFGPSEKDYESSKASYYYLEVLVPDSEADGIFDPKKAKGLLAYYLRLGFKVLSVVNDPTQPGTKVVILGIDHSGWFKIMENSKKRRGLELLKVPVYQINFNSPNHVERVEPAVLSCRSLFN